MQVRETGLLNLSPEIFHRFRSLFKRAETSHEIADREDGENRAPVDLDIFRKLEVLVDDPCHYLLELVPVNVRIEQALFVVPPLVIVPVVVLHVMVGPHDVEIHLVMAGSSQEAVVQRTLQIRAAVAIGIVVPVPIVDEGIDPILEGSLDPLFHHDGIIVHLIAPERLTGLVMLGETLVSLLDHLPLPYTFFPEPFMTELVVMTGWPDIGADIGLFSIGSDSSSIVT